MTPEWRDYLGRVVRAAWIQWANQQSDVKVGWLLPWDELNEADQEADRMIGEAVWAVAESVQFRSGNNSIGSGPPLDRLAWVLADTLTIDPARFVRAGRPEDA